MWLLSYLRSSTRVAIPGLFTFFNSVLPLVRKKSQSAGRQTVAVVVLLFTLQRYLNYYICTDIQSLTAMLVPSPPNSYVDILTPKSDGTWSGTFQRCLGHEGGALIHGNRALIKEALQSSLTGVPMWGHCKNPAIQKRAFAHDLGPDLGLQLLELGGQSFCCLLPPSLWHFVTAAEQPELITRLFSGCPHSEHGKD